MRHFVLNFMKDTEDLYFTVEGFFFLLFQTVTMCMV